MIKDKFNSIFFPFDQKPGHFKSLDGLRGLAVLFVLLSHSSNKKLFFHELFNFERIGKIGVYLFFVLSAYLLDRQIAEAFLNNKATSNYWKNYFLRRFLRIYPLFVIALILHGTFTIVGIPTVIDRMIDLPLHMLLLKGERIFWSIPVEFKYYFISPLILWFCHQYLKWDKPKLLCLFIILIISSTVIELVFKLPMVSSFKFFPIFLVGTFISIYELLFEKEINKAMRPKVINIISGIALATIIIMFPHYFEKISGLNVNFNQPKFYLLFGVLWGIVLVGAKYGKGIIQKILELKMLRFLGTISFSLYLFHMLFLKLILLIEIPSFLRIYLFFILSILFSSITFILIERPFSKIRYKSPKA